MNLCNIQYKLKKEVWAKTVRRVFFSQLWNLMTAAADDLIIKLLLLLGALLTAIKSMC